MLCELYLNKKQFQNEGANQESRRLGIQESEDAPGENPKYPLDDCEGRLREQTLRECP